MRPTSVSKTGTGASALVPLDIYVPAFNVGLLVTTASGVTGKVEYTMDDVQSPTFDADTAKWFDHATLVNVTNTSSYGSLSTPVTAVRLNITAGTGVGSLRVVQVGTR